MDDFVINKIEWHIKYVRSDDQRLMRSDGSMTVGMTNWITKTIYLAEELRGAFLEHVLCHELCHCICFSYGIIMDMRQEEFLAEWVSLYGRQVIELLDAILGQIKGA